MINYFASCHFNGGKYVFLACLDNARSDFEKYFSEKKLKCSCPTSDDDLKTTKTSRNLYKYSIKDALEVNELSGTIFILFKSCIVCFFWILLGFSFAFTLAAQF